MSAGAKRVATRLKVFGFLALGVVALIAWLVIDPPEADDSSTVSGPDREMSAQTVAKLARASAVQGVCYGWHLTDGSTTVSRGSNLGAGVAVDSDPDRCPRWVEVYANVWYPSASSEAADSASTDIRAAGVAALPTSRLDRFGLTSKAFIDEPDWAICQAALVLPLLTAESGAAPPAPAGTPASGEPSGDPSPAAVPDVPAATAVPAALPAAGSDFWRDRWGYVLGAVFLLLVAALTVAIGWFERRHQRPPATPRRSAGPRPNPTATTAKR